MRTAEHIWWHVYPLAACGAPIREERTPGDRLRALLPWVSLAAESGYTGILLGPVFQSVAHGYDTLDHFRIDDRLGDDAVFDEFVSACSYQGVAVILDGVFNHVAVEHAWVSQNGPIKRDDQGNPVGWEGDGSLAELDHSDPRVEDAVVEIMCHWLERGIAGWRLDVAYAVPRDFWARVTWRVREKFPEAIFLGEMIHGDYAELASGTGIDAVTQYELWKAIWSSLKDENFFELEHALGRHAEFSSRAIMQTFIGNHDVNRIASVVGEPKAALAAVALFTLPGLPSVYYGDERAALGVRGQGAEADDPVRPALDDLDAAGDLAELYTQLIRLRRAHPWLAEATLQVAEVENQRITFTAHAQGNEVATHLSLVDGCHAHVHINGEHVVDFSR
ncbi:alpha-amylase [Corynebacterium tapiri]|uniref:Alpha-amylase n=2 Tax=Corynebacterium tapiri TaxID=1448266 RepID=A0A5C4U856_9CORY|nr:alpha-amylase [Corynebacterium tapiri]